MIFYAKSELPNGRHPTVREHLEKVAALSSQFGESLSMRDEAALAGLLHDFGKYSDLFQKVLSHDIAHIDHALPGAVLLSAFWKAAKKEGMIRRSKHVIEAVAGHHDGLRNALFVTANSPAAGKTASISDHEAFAVAQQAFLQDFPGFRFPVIPDQHIPGNDTVASMLYTRMLFSCLVDADYSVSASDLNEDYLEETTNECFDPGKLLTRLTAYRDVIRKNSKANGKLNSIRDEFYEYCGNAGEENEEGIFTLTGPTGIGKTLTLMHFSLRHCDRWNKKRIIVVLPFLSLTEQTVREYRNIVDFVLEDTSQVEWTENAREYSSRWSTPVIITTSVKFFEALFSDQPTVCRKLHHIANSVILFDEAQSLPNEVLGCTIKSVEELCSRYHVSMVFSTATQPDYHSILAQWNPKEIYPDYSRLFRELKRVNVSWRLKKEEPLSDIALEMSKRKSVCAIVNLRKHARELYKSLISFSSEEECFFLTTDLCAEHRSHQIQAIKERLKEGVPCRVVATQCIEAGVDLDFDVMFRALAPLEAIIQAAGRCNRNGRIPGGGEVIVFIPASAGRMYPGDWYMQGAAVVAQMFAEDGPIDLNDPAMIQMYYRYLFKGQKDKPELTEAIENRDYAKTRKEYRLIENRGVQVIVPYGAIAEKYEKIRRDLLEHGLVRAQMRELAPYTVTCTLPFEKLSSFAESVPLPNRIRTRLSDGDQDSGYYLLRAQCQKWYTSKMGLSIREDGHNWYLQ